MAFANYPSVYSNTPHGLAVNAFPSNFNPHDAHLHATLERIDQIANDDVEMQAPLSEQVTFIVLDTNILLHHFEPLQRFISDIETLSVPVVVIVPGAVIYELDGQKNRDGLAWFARRASAWLLKKVKERKTVRGQANEETCKASGNWKIRSRGEELGSERVNDALILDCCQFFARGRRTFLCSADNNLCVESESVHIPSISPSRHWSSRELARAVFGHNLDLNRFGEYHASYRDPKSANLLIAPGPSVIDHDDDGMEIDEDASQPEILLPSHALDLLHIQVIDHFSRLLVELVGRVGGPEIRQASGGSSASRYAPQWARTGKTYLEWTASDCLDYLNGKQPLRPTSPRVDIFLSRPYSCPGARRGQDWSKMDWDVALGALARVGAVWEEDSIQESLGVLEPHLAGVFATRMRPTGI